MNDFKVAIQTILSKTGVKKNLTELQDFLNKNLVEIIPQLKTATLKNDLKSVSKLITNEIKKSFDDINISDKDVYGALIKQIKTIATETDKINISTKLKDYLIQQNALTDESKVKIKDWINTIESSDDLTKDSLKNIQNEFKKLKVAINEVNKENSLLATNTDKINVSTKLNNYLIKNKSITESSQKQIKEWISTIQSSDDLTKNDLTNINNQFKQLDTQMRSIGKLGSIIATETNKINVSTKLNKYLVDQISLTDSAKLKIQEWINTIQSSDNLTKDSLNNIQNEFKKLKVDVDAVNKANSLLATSTDKIGVSSQLQNYLIKNTALTKDAKKQVKEWINTIESADNLTKDDLINLNNQFKQLDVNMRKTGNLGDSLGNSISKGMKSFTTWVGATTIVMGAINKVRQMIDEVKELDKSLVELSKVSDLTAGELSKITDEAFKLGEQFAKTGRTALDAITDFKRAGYELNQSTDFAGLALKMVNVSENIQDAAVSAKYLISIMKGYNDSSKEFAEHIIDSVNAVSNTRAINYDNLVDGAQNLSAVADQANTSFDQMLGLLTGGYEVLGDVSKVSNGLITIFSRLQATDFTGSGEEVETIAKLQKKFSDATHGMVNIIDLSTGQLRSAYDIMKDMADIWDTLDANTQSALAQSAAGKRNMPDDIVICY